MNQDIISQIISALRSDDAATVAYAKWYINEVDKARTGHWHHETVPCDEQCPMGDERTRKAFQQMLQTV